MDLPGYIVYHLPQRRVCDGRGGFPLARRRRAVERASHRQAIVDRIVIGVLVVVAASGLMSLLPAQSQIAVSRFACRAGSLGLGSCGSSAWSLGSDQLAPPRCPILARFDRALPEVQVHRTVTADGLDLEISSARSGDTYLQIGTEDGSAPPFLLDGEPRAMREVLPGASVSTHGEWYLPKGDGADSVLEAVAASHAQWVRRRSALAVLAMASGRAGRTIPPPTALQSQVRLDAAVLPSSRDEGSSPGPSTPTGLPAGLGTSQVSALTSLPALLTFNRITQTSSLVFSVSGVVRDSPVVGSVRETRDPTGAVTSVLLAVVSTGQLVSREPRPAGTSQGSQGFGGTVGVAYIALSVTSADERDLVSRWLSDPAGFRLGLDELLGLRPPNVSDQLTSYLTRAATVTVLRYSGVDAARAAQQVSQEVVSLRRVDWAGAKLLAVGEVAPQPTRAARVLVTDRTCGTL